MLFAGWIFTLDEEVFRLKFYAVVVLTA